MNTLLRQLGERPLHLRGHVSSVMSRTLSGGAKTVSENHLFAHLVVVIIIPCNLFIKSKPGMEGITWIHGYGMQALKSMLAMGVSSVQLVLIDLIMLQTPQLNLMILFWRIPSEAWTILLQCLKSTGVTNCN